jgi:hypothetical protein
VHTADVALEATRDELSVLILSLGDDPGSSSSSCSSSSCCCCPRQARMEEVLTRCAGLRQARRCSAIHFLPPQLDGGGDTPAAPVDK